MKTVEIKIYSFSELSPKSRETALSQFRDMNLHEHLFSEYFDSIKFFCKCFYIDLKDIYLDNQDWRATFPNLDEDNEETVGEFLSSQLPKGDCPFTGVCYDETLLDPVRENLTNTSTDSEDLRSVLSDSLYAICRAYQNEVSYLYSDEYLTEFIEANDYEFTEDGSIYR